MLFDVRFGREKRNALLQFAYEPIRDICSYFVLTVRLENYLMLRKSTFAITFIHSYSSVCSNVKIIFAMDTFEKEFKDKLYERYRLTKRHLIPKDIYQQIISDYKQASLQVLTKSRNEYYILSK